MEQLTPREWRRIKELSVEQVAKALGYSANTWAKYEKQPSTLPIDKAEAFCQLVGCSWGDVKFLP